MCCITPILYAVVQWYRCACAVQPSPGRPEAPEAGRARSGPAKAGSVWCNHLVCLQMRPLTVAFKMGIDVDLWRARIGMWEARKRRFHRQRSKRGGGKISFRELGTVIGLGGATACCLVFALSVMILLSGDVERNPGPLSKGISTHTMLTI